MKRHVTRLDTVRCGCEYGPRLHRWTNAVRGECIHADCDCIGFASGEYVARPTSVSLPKAAAR